MIRARWVHPDTHEISKFLPHDPPTEALAMGGGLAEAHEFGIERGIEEYHARRPIPDPVFTSPDELSVESEPQGIRNVDACRSYGRPCPALEMCHERGA